MWAEIYRTSDTEMITMNFTPTIAATNSNFIQSTVDPFAIVGATQIAVVIESTFLILVSTVAFTANVSLWMVVLTTRDLRTESNVLILCLSLADLLVSVLGAPITVSSIINSRWLFSRDLCTFVGYMNMLTFVASVQSLGVISLNRYFKICRPAKYLDIYTFRNVGFMFLGVWLYSGLLSIPPLIGWASYDFLPLASICFCNWAESPTYAVFMILMCFCVPCFAMILCYVAIIKAFLRSRRAVMAFASSVRSAPNSSKEPDGNQDELGTDRKINNQMAANGTARDRQVRRTSALVSPSSRVHITENPVEPEIPDEGLGRNLSDAFKDASKETNATDRPDEPSNPGFNFSKSNNNTIKVDNFSQRELRPISEGFEFPSFGDIEEMHSEENHEHMSQLVPNSSSLRQQLSVQDIETDYDFTDNASRYDSDTGKTIHGNNNRYHASSSAQLDENDPVAMLVTTDEHSDNNPFFRIERDSHMLSSIMENSSPKHADTSENKFDTRSPINRSHSYAHPKDNFSTEYGATETLGFQYNRSFSEVPASSHSPNGTLLVVAGFPNSVNFTIGQHHCFQQVVDGSLLKEDVYSSDDEPSRGGKTLQRLLLPKHTLLPSVDSLHPFHSHTPSSASTSLASSDFSSSSNQHIPLNVFQSSSEHASKFNHKPLSPTPNSLRLSRSEETISKLSTVAVADTDLSLNNIHHGAHQKPLRKCSKALSASSPTILSSEVNRTKSKPQVVLHSQKRSREEFQLAGSLLVVILIFIICWFPYCISMFVSITSTSNHALDITSLLLGYMNSCVNPIVYGLMNRRFKVGYRKMYLKLARMAPCSRKFKVAPMSNISKSNSSIS